MGVNYRVHSPQWKCVTTTTTNRWVKTVTIPGIQVPLVGYNYQVPLFSWIMARPCEYHYNIIIVLYTSLRKVLFSWAKASV